MLSIVLFLFFLVTYLPWIQDRRDIRQATSQGIWVLHAPDGFKKCCDSSVARFDVLFSVSSLVTWTDDILVAEVPARYWKSI